MVSADIFFSFLNIPTCALVLGVLFWTSRHVLRVCMYVAFLGIPAVVFAGECLVVCQAVTRDHVAPLWSPCPRIFSGILFHVDCSVRSFAPERCRKNEPLSPSMMSPTLSAPVSTSRCAKLSERPWAKA